MSQPIKLAVIAAHGAVLSTDAPASTHRLASLRLVANVIPALTELQQRGVELALIDASDPVVAAQLCSSQGLRVSSLPGASVAHVETIIANYLIDCDCVPQAAAVIAPDGPFLDAARALGARVCEFTPRDGDLNAWPALVQNLTARTTLIERATKETRIIGSVNLDAVAPIAISTGIGFFDHMLEQLAKHGGFSLELRCEGDLEIDEHHTVEDCALALGDALRRALGAKLGIARYGFLLAMDEAEAQVAIDLSGRAYALFEGRFTRESVGGLPTELVPHFYRSLADSLGAAIHISVRGDNAHHMIEASFKSVGRALRQACSRSGTELPTTKGSL
ncbi:MAG: imidazoleglycerol-phosphate dehydratase HisB [Pseudomonadales bacterium]|nr:imidazoleglycerol-phosphate dehydratase HisB [Pseudomonadales bacterium]